MIINAELARRIEGVEAAAAVDLAAGCVERGVIKTFDMLSVGGGTAVFGGVDSHFSVAIGIGLAGPVTAEDIDVIESFYGRRQAATMIHLCPLADASLLPMLVERGYQPIEFNSVFVRHQAAGDALVANVAETTADDADAWVRIMAGAYGMGDEIDDATAAIIKSCVVQAATTTPTPSARWQNYIIRDGGSAVAGGTMFTCDGAGMLFGDGTLDAFRGRGYQSALIRHRLGVLAAAGVDIAATTTLPGSVSGRNYQRMGFTPAYTKIVFRREHR